MDHALSRLSPITLLPKSLENKTSTQGSGRRVPQGYHQVCFLCAFTTHVVHPNVRKPIKYIPGQVLGKKLGQIQKKPPSNAGLSLINCENMLGLRSGCSVKNPVEEWSFMKPTGGGFHPGTSYEI